MWAIFLLVIGLYLAIDYFVMRPAAKKLKMPQYRIEQEQFYSEIAGITMADGGKPIEENKDNK